MNIKLLYRAVWTRNVWVCTKCSIISYISLLNYAYFIGIDKWYNMMTLMISHVLSVRQTSKWSIDIITIHWKLFHTICLLFVAWSSFKSYNLCSLMHKLSSFNFWPAHNYSVTVSSHSMNCIKLSHHYLIMFW